MRRDRLPDADHLLNQLVDRVPLVGAPMRGYADAGVPARPIAQRSRDLDDHLGWRPRWR